ncbi:MAG: methyltransferase domain-containing protein [Spirochaetes bacterium]|nr:methyltransferase domain-containing protein [Spirochaetota bacterium]
MLKDNRRHYNSVIDAWSEFMNDNIHFGYYKTEKTTLKESGDELINQMISLTTVKKNHRILDVGCGVGNPAFYLHNKFKCSVTGISTSQRGVEIANETSGKLGLAKSVRFKVADGTRNGFPDESFDIVWAMESSHLMRKDRLIRESYRVLKPGGTFLLCDVVFKCFTLKYIYTLPPHLFRLLALRRGYGNVWAMPKEYYFWHMNKAGFREITSIDVGENSMPTLRDWTDRINREKDTILKKYSQSHLKDFMRACEAMEHLFKKNIVTYVIMKTVKD